MSAAQPDLFDHAEALRRRDEGLAQVESAATEWLYFARMEARRQARLRGTVTMDNVRAELTGKGIEPPHSNVYGAVFKHKDFEWTGDYARSAVVQGHGNLQRVWRLKE